MIKTLYPKFQEWSSTGSIYIISDTHFEDSDCKLMDPDWITPQEHIDIIKEKIQRPDTLIHLGDVGDGKWLDQIPAHNKILITGNHDVLSKVSQYFTDIYTGPLFIADRILLSHEPIEGLEEIAMNIHGHDHMGIIRRNHTNLASNIYGYKVFNLGNAIKDGLLSNIENYHRNTIDKATKKKMGCSPIETDCSVFASAAMVEEACKTCPNHPDNGGSGICNCTLRLPKITG